jgi:hypothetical protein
VIARIFVYALRVLAALYLVRLLLRWLASLGQPAAPRASGGGQGQIAADLVRDRVCNTFVPRDRAVSAVVAGHEEHFCSIACRDRALAAAATAP